MTHAHFHPAYHWIGLLYNGLWAALNCFFVLIFWQVPKTCKFLFTWRTYSHSLPYPKLAWFKNSRTLRKIWPKVVGFRSDLQLIRPPADSLSALLQTRLAVLQDRLYWALGRSANSAAPSFPFQFIDVTAQGAQPQQQPQQQQQQVRNKVQDLCARVPEWALCCPDEVSSTGSLWFAHV